MASINVSHNIAAVARDLSDVARKQLPFATSLALNATAADVKANTDKRLGRVVDRPTPFTMRAFTVQRSSRRRFEAVIFAKDIQSAYLQFLEAGGVRTPSGRAVVVPVGVRLNQFGNMARGAIGRLLAQPGTFSGRAGMDGAGGIYQRVADGLRLLAFYTPAARYRRRLEFQEGAFKTATARLPYHFERALLRAVASAR